MNEADQKPMDLTMFERGERVFFRCNRCLETWDGGTIEKTEIVLAHWECEGDDR